MMTCKQISRLLAEGDYASLPPLKKLYLRLHVTICFLCGRFNRQVMVMQDTCRHYRENEDALLDRQPGLDESAKERLRAVLAEESSQRD